jgi:hypothetical protein
MPAGREMMDLAPPSIRRFGVAAALVAAARAPASPGGVAIEHPAPYPHPTGPRWRTAGGHKGRGYTG